MNLKETDFNHIGLIPINWDVVRLKDIAQINKGSVFDEKLSSVDGIYPYINGGINPSDWSNHFNTKENTIAVSEGGASAGYTQFMTTKYWAGSHCYKIQSKNKNSDNKYLFYVLKGFEKYLMIEKTGSAMPNLQKTKFINYLVSFVNNIEIQNKIVSYLDTETLKIDRKISILEQKFEKLEEYKQSVIFETVTKGLNSNVAMKDSGIDWIGVIPNHWEILRLKDSSIIKKGESFDEKLASADGIYPYINGGINPSDWSNYFNTKENTIAVSEGGASAGYTQFMATKYWAGSHCYKIQSKNKNSNNKYLFYILKGFEKYLMIEKTGSAMPNLQKTKFINYLVSFVNDIEEQNKIVNYLDNKTTKINKQKEIIQKKIELLKEYKQTIIYEAVTGKFKVEN